MESIVTFYDNECTWIIYKSNDTYGVAVQLLEYTFKIRVYGSIEECTEYIQTQIN